MRTFRLGILLVASRSTSAAAGCKRSLLENVRSMDGSDDTAGQPN